MKKLCVCYSNCQGAGVVHFLKQTRLAEQYDFKVWLNYRLMLSEESPTGLHDDVRRADILFYQPTTSFDCRDGTHVLSTDEMIKELFKGSRAISMAYQFNSGFFPIVKSGRFWTGDWWLYMAKESPENLLSMFDNGMMQPFDCARRFAENLAEQSRREIGCTIQTATWILQHFQTKHLFLLHNHPSSALLAHIAEEVVAILDPKLAAPIPFDGPNDAGLPGYHGVHPAVVRELGLQYEPDRRGEDMEFYRALISELATTKGKI